MGDPTIQGKVKQISNIDALVADTLGLSCGSDTSNLVPMKDLVVGNVSSMLTGQPSQVVTDLVSGQAKTYINPTNTVPGQIAIRQSNPLPATVLGVVLEVDVQSETFGGILIPFMSSLLKDTERAFAAFNEALKARTEAA